MTAGLPANAVRSDVPRTEAILWRIVRVLLILVGITLLLSPRVSYTRRETVFHSRSADVSARRPTTLVVPPAVAALVIAAGVLTLLLATGKRHS